MPSLRQCDEKQFLHDAREHQMSILMDNGLYRHLRFKRPGTSSYWFDIVTWPGRLCISGDMGTYVFNRLEDMFEFFRIDRRDWSYKANGLSINPGYWSEKLEANDKNGGSTAFSADTFREKITQRFNDWVEDNKPEDDESQEVIAAFNEKKQALWEEIDACVLIEADNGEHAAYSAAMGFSSDEAERFDFADFFEVNCREFTFHYLWCCYAIAWAIQQYDKAKENTTAPAEDVPA